jgi:hypothetical protein
MADSMETNVSLGRLAAVGGIPRVKSRDFESKRHPFSKREKEKKKGRNKGSSDQTAEDSKAQDASGDTGQQKRRKRETKASGSRLDVIA